MQAMYFHYYYAYTTLQMKKNKSKNIIAMIPARMGSTRLTMKNLALLNGKPLIYYAINAAKDSEVFKRIVINSEDSFI